VCVLCVGVCGVVCVITTNLEARTE
jgi:hypothetical protein